MKYKELHKDLFTVSEEYYFVQCISADFAMGKGIAVEFNERFNTRTLIRQQNPDYLKHYKNFMKIENEHIPHFRCIRVGRVFNLITKERYFYKPTYNNMRKALIDLHDSIMNCNYNSAAPTINHLAMPRIGCGLDGMNWDMVSAMIQDIFSDMDIEILVCYQ